jgi:hypothetical protein
MADIGVNRTVGSVSDSVPYVQWGPAFAGAIAAAALAFVLHSFAGAVGLAVSSASPTWRDASAGLWFLSGFYLVVVAAASYSLGGYIAGRMRARLNPNATEDEVEARDGIHGLVVWGLATLATALMIAIGAGISTKLAAPSAGAAGPAASVAGENIIAYDLDRLFRAERRPAAAEMEYVRSEASRILLMSQGHNGIPAEDRSYLVRLVSLVTSTAPADAERRVEMAITNAHDNMQRARKASIIIAFMAGAAAAIGAAAAWFAACKGGHHRDGGTVPSVWIGGRRPAMRV